MLKAHAVVEAVRLAGTTPAIHLLLTEFSMPETDGLELTRRFRTLHPASPVLMLSASLKELDNRVRELDRFATLAKPFSLEGLINKVRTLPHVAASFPLRTTSKTARQPAGVMVKPRFPDATRFGD